MSPVVRIALSVAAGQVVWGLRHRLPAPGRGWERTNHRGEPLSLVEGPAVVAALAVGAADDPAMVVAVLGAGAAGLVDDLAETTTVKGLRGHLGALRRGRVTTGALKIVVVGVSGSVAAQLAGPSRPVVDRVLGGALVAASANVINLFDLRPGRALKVTILGAAALRAFGRSPESTGPVALSMLRVDLAERAMMGDAGANALGAALGVEFVNSGVGRRGLLAGLTALTALTLASERVSFTRVIEATPVLRHLDAWGRRP